MKSLLALDMGNSGLKGALFSGQKITGRFRFTVNESGDAGPELIRRFSPEGIVFCSVVPGWTGTLLSQAERAGEKRILQVNSDSTLPFQLMVDSPETLGADRICAAAGARAGGAKEAVIVDIGTAVTVDLLSSRGFEGGAIFPGIRTALDSLGRSAAALPVIDYSGGGQAPSRLPGSSTEKAIKAGTYWGIAGAMDKLVEMTARAAGTRPEIYLTGGWAGEFKDAVSFPFIHEPDLVFRGLELIFYNS
ncbi:MAG: type III pantothenate kinase [Candidatus Latescibacteria bacterium]|nr:type III pantothenate kinase [bacterium]MBD3423684.1 type III pantothenate kinase [Candidatus Latescibacterota bacterium]